MMKITVITGSPHRRGTSALLADEFIRGAGEAGHEVFRFDAAFEKVGPCLGCDKCRDGGACIQKDSMEKLNPVLLESDLVVFVTPLYYFGISAQLKTVIDRFYAENDRLQKSKNKAVLMATAYDGPEAMKALEHSYEAIVEYLEWEDAGRILAAGCGVRSDIEESQYPRMAYEMGRGEW